MPGAGRETVSLDDTPSHYRTFRCSRRELLATDRASGNKYSRREIAPSGTPGEFAANICVDAILGGHYHLPACD